MSLTQLSQYLRKYYPYGILGILLFLILFYAVQVTMLVINSRKVTPGLTNTIFNQLKVPYLSEATPSGNLKYTIDTIEGKPITATDTARVFFLPQAETKFGYREKIYLIAKSLGFNTEAIGYRLIGSQATFTEPEQKLTIDIKSFNFAYRYNFETIPNSLDNTRPPTHDESVQHAVQFLQAAGRYPQELSQGKTNVIYLKYDQKANSMQILNDNREANMVEVDFYRPDIDAQPSTMPVVAPKFFNSQNYVLMSFRNDGTYKILRAQVKFFEKSEQQQGVYPLRTGEQAFEDLKNGKGFIVSQPGTQDVTIRRMFLGYFDPDVYQEYFQPVYVFLGDDDFVGYVPAVSKQFMVE